MENLVEHFKELNGERNWGKWEVDQVYTVIIIAVVITIMAIVITISIIPVGIIDKRCSCQSFPRPSKHDKTFFC